ncbi:MAG: hypothetical protein KC468_13005, partial [Myxococcales bacterium]|nr:hypothetical protein [Myxococcales bacterium]
ELASHRELARVDSSTPSSMRAACEARAERRAVKAELRRVRAESRRARKASRQAARAAARAEAAARSNATTAVRYEYSTIDRAALEEALENPTTLAAQATVIPSMRDGVFQGYKLVGVRLGSLPMSVGFRSGDLVTEINGRPLADGGFSHRFDAMPGEPPSAIAFTVIRRGEPVRKVIEIR